jgi:hypothetical protein
VERNGRDRPQGGIGQLLLSPAMQPVAKGLRQLEADEEVVAGVVGGFLGDGRRSYDGKAPRTTPTCQKACRVPR